MLHELVYIIEIVLCTSFFTLTVQDNLQKNEREVAIELTAKHRLRIFFEN